MWKCRNFSKHPLGSVIVRVSVTMKKISTTIIIKWFYQNRVFNDLKNKKKNPVLSKWNYIKASTVRFTWQFYGKKEVSIETIFIFIFYCATVSRENCMKLAALFSDYFGIKNETGWWFHNFKGHKIMKPPELIGKKDETDGTRFDAKIIRK